MQTTTPHLLTFPDTDSAPYAKARYHYLLQIVFGETMAVDYCRTMATFAPTKEASDFLLQQQVEEDTHLGLLTEYLGTHPRPEVLISPHLKKLHLIMEDALERKDYVDAVFIQNFIVEGLNISLLKELEHHTDVALSELATIILKDEVRHAEFGVTELQRILQEDPSEKLAKKLKRLHVQSIIYAALLSFTLTREAKDIGIPAFEMMRKTFEEHMDRIKRARLPLSIIDRILLRAIYGFLYIF